MVRTASFRQSACTTWTTRCSSASGPPSRMNPASTRPSMKAACWASPTGLQRPQRSTPGPNAEASRGTSGRRPSPLLPRWHRSQPTANMCSCKGEASILHADLDAFYASVEQRDDPRLRGRPVIVGAGVVLAASYEAKACGVRTAMGGRQARRLCPRAIVVAAAHVGLLRGEQGGLPDLRGHDAARRGHVDRRGVPRRARVQAARRRAVRHRPAAAAPDPRARSACRSRSASRGRSSWPRWRAAWRSPTGSSSCRRRTSSTSCTRCRWNGSGASAT